MIENICKRTAWKLATLFIFCVILSGLLFSIANHSVTKKIVLIDQTLPTQLDNLSLNGLSIGHSIPENYYSFGQRYASANGIVTKLWYEAPYLSPEQSHLAIAASISNNRQQIGPDYQSIQNALGNNYYCIPGGKKDEILYIDKENQLMLHLWHDEKNTYATLQALSVETIVGLPEETKGFLNAFMYPVYFSNYILQGKLAPVQTYQLFPFVVFLFLFPFLLFATSRQHNRKRLLPLFIFPFLLCFWHMAVYILLRIAKSGI